jgi:hypothetical protein
MATIQVSGAIEVSIFLKDLVSEKNALAVCKELAERTAIKAFQLAPEDTGAMEEDIRVEPCNDGYLVICSVPYAWYNEYGTYSMQVGDEKDPMATVSTSGKACYRPFFRPAAYQTLDELDEIINSVFFGRVVST